MQRYPQYFADGPSGHPGSSGDGAAPAAPAAAPAIGAGAGGGSSGDGAAAAAEEPFPEVVDDDDERWSNWSVVGGNQTPHGIMSDWDVNGMVRFLESISLGHLSKAFIENGLDGAFFLQCSQEELAEIGLTALQFKKIMAYAPGGPKNQ